MGSLLRLPFLSFAVGSVFYGGVSLCFWMYRTFVWQWFLVYSVLCNVGAILILIPSLIHEFELRRFIFGLTAIVNTDPSTLPDLVRDRLPDIVQWLAKLCGLMEESRMKQVREKERENGPPSYEGNQQNNGEYQDEDEYDDEDEESEGESAEINSRIIELKKAF
jgi:hypothetical protein